MVSASEAAETSAIPPVRVSAPVFLDIRAQQCPAARLLPHLLPNQYWSHHIQDTLLLISQVTLRITNILLCAS